MIWNIALMALTAAGLWLLIEHLLYRFDQEAKRRHYHDEFLARMDESRWRHEQQRERVQDAILGVNTPTRPRCH